MWLGRRAGEGRIWLSTRVGLEPELVFAFGLFGVTEPKAAGGVMCLVRCCEPEMEMIIVNGRDLYRSKGELVRKSCHRWMGDPGRQPERPRGSRGRRIGGVGDSRTNPGLAPALAAVSCSNCRL
jgi:hypothetical protein